MCECTSEFQPQLPMSEYFSARCVDPAVRNIGTDVIKELHLFAGIGGGIYGGKLLGHVCCGGIEIDPFCQTVLQQRQKDGWLEPFEVFGDICALNGEQFRNSFDVLCGGFPCQAFSTAAHGKNIASKNLWNEMLRFVQESEAPVVFAENVVLKAIEKARTDLERLGYKVERCRLSCSDLGADHQRNRFWLLAVKDENVFERVAEKSHGMVKLSGACWAQSPHEAGLLVPVANRRAQLKGIGNAQSPYVAASAFRVLINRHINSFSNRRVNVSENELKAVFSVKKTWIQREFNNIGLVHTPTTMANYAAKSMMKHAGCRNFAQVFKKPEPENAEYLMGFPLGASSPEPQLKENLTRWEMHQQGDGEL